MCAHIQCPSAREDREEKKKKTYSAVRSVVKKKRKKRNTTQADHFTPGEDQQKHRFRLVLKTTGGRNRNEFHFPLTNGDVILER